MNIYIRTTVLTLIFVTLTAFSLSAHAMSWNGKVYRVSTQTEISKSDLFSDLAHADIIVMGEKHYTEAVQLAESEVIESVLAVKGGDWTLGWEFLNHTEKALNDHLWSLVMSDQLSVYDFLIKTQGSPSASVYAPMFESLKKFNGHLLGLNLTRSEKTPVSKNGISAVDPALLPPNYSSGGLGYRERFEAVMQGHVTPTQLNNYFDAQCLTDDVMAYEITQNKVGTAFLVAGSFHTDFNDGTVARIQARAPEYAVSTVRIIDASDYLESELLTTLSDPKYGSVADFVFFVNEPQP